ncbi:hypothetical protein [Oceanobacillus sp. Castelsardo]|nr:hypothetical protein [Oceanobacillus sp. Castelsardo]
MTFTDELSKGNENIFQLTFDNPFVQEIRKSKLPKEIVVQPKKKAVTHS